MARPVGRIDRVERAEPVARAPPVRAQMDSAAAVARAAGASVALAELLKEKQPWKGKRHRSKQLAGGHACDKSSQQGFLSTPRPTFSDVLIEGPVSRQPRTSSYSSRNGCPSEWAKLTPLGRFGTGAAGCLQDWGASTKVRAQPQPESPARRHRRNGNSCICCITRRGAHR